MTRKCYESSLKNRRGTYAVTIQPEELGWIAKAEISNKKQPGPAGEVQEREIKGKKFNINTTLGKELKDRITDVILVNMNVFARSSIDMSGIDPDFLCHQLTMDETVKPMVQRRRKFHEEKCLVIREETRKLVAAGHIREIQYPEWLANVVLVKKANGK